VSDALSSPASFEELYIARGKNSAPHRPLMQGDVVDGVQLPLFTVTPTPVIVLTHPCSMRAGAALRKTQLVCKVKAYQHVPLEDWNRHLRWMPLPTLNDVGADNMAASFEEMTAVATEDLPLDNRLACLSPHGISILQQRLTYYLTRLAPPLVQLINVCAHVLEEADLLEEWTEAGSKVGAESAAAAQEFDEFIRGSPGGDLGSWQDALRDPARRASVRRASRERMAAVFPS
jgi:hypothetical protein